jgi:hypothetical protein
MGLLRLAPFSTIVRHLGYPDYFLTILGVSNLLAAVALLVPGIARVKEWAYAGLLFNYGSAAISHAAVGDRIWMVLTPLVFAGIALVSWAFQPKERLRGSSPFPMSS